MEKKTNDIVELDLMFLLKKLWKQKVIIIITAILFAGSAVAYSNFFVEPLYKSTTKIYTVSQMDPTKTLTVQDIQIGTNLVKDYQQIILSAEVLNTVIEENALSLTKAELANKILITAPRDTHVVEITVSDTDAVRAGRLANAIREASITKIQEVTKVSDITTIEEATTATAPYLPNTRKMGVMAGIAGLFLSGGLVLLKEMLDDRVKRPEDIEEGMDMVLLGIIPDTKKGKKA